MDLTNCALSFRCSVDNPGNLDVLLEFGEVAAERRVKSKRFPSDCLT